MKYAVLSVGLALLGAAACQQKDAEAPVAEAQVAEVPAAGFEFTVNKTGMELAFKGVRGTQWRELAYTCTATPCEFILDSTGVNANTPISGFGIAFSLDAKEVNMTSAAGASWIMLKYACEDEQCSFKVDEKGVAGI
jgi:hypothetical protein